MKEREGFSLAELMVAVFIFSFVAAALATISSTAHRHMFQNYRSNVIKTNVLVAMRDIQNNLSVATRIDVPVAGVQGDMLAFAVNVDQNSGCYPISAADTPAWHYFCIAVPVSANCPSGNCLYHHTTAFGGNSNPACSGMTAPAAPFTTASYPNFCGPGGGGTVTLLMERAMPLTTLFSRRTADGINEVDTVRIRLRSTWDATARGFASTQRDVDFGLDTVVKVNRSR
ncbi:MAG: prepilin-type N-terminal cleavage/methylation domain-containing protein [Elusimicrobiota bacterium]|nr:prepilin-type N-terminal cleavage/methylation domain-containing protein [Elusimicrobiota bacterium]